jgi:phosphoribosylformylglycinamidine (FGAM) synthase-like enzyme
VLGAPTIASKRWVFGQYDHEVGIRTIAKPGDADAALLKLPNNKFAAIKVDGNARVCDLDPYVGGASVLAECCRNIVAVGAEPAAWLDHCQFGDPNDEEIFWAFSQAVKGMADFARTMSLPCIGGKVSFYNEDDETGKPIKPSPVVAVLGLIEGHEHITKMGFRQDGEAIVAVGKTMPELGGSEYYHILGFDGLRPPILDFEIEKRTYGALLECIRNGLITACHDSSKGGIVVTLAEMALVGDKGASVDLGKLPADEMRDDERLFSESNSRFLVATNTPRQVLESMHRRMIPATAIGEVGGRSLNLKTPRNELELSLDRMRVAYEESLQRILEPWQK